MIKVLLKDFILYGAHLGHLDKKWNPVMSNYLKCVRGGYHIFDLVKMSYNLRKCLFFITYLIKSGGKILFITTKLGTKKFFYKFFSKVLQLSITSKWTPGFLTNFRHARKRHYKKTNLNLPDLVVLLDLNSRFNYQLPLIEAKKMGIPTMGIVDSNMNPALFDYKLLGNNDSTSSLYFFSKFLRLAVLEGYRYYDRIRHYYREEFRELQMLKRKALREFRDLQIRPILQTYYEVLYYARDPVKYKDEENEEAYSIVFSPRASKLSRSPLWHKVETLFDYTKYEVEAKRGLNYDEWIFVHDKHRQWVRAGLQEDNITFYTYQIKIRQPKLQELAELLFDARMPENVARISTEYYDLLNFVQNREKLLEESKFLYAKFTYEYENYYKDLSTYQSYMKELWG